MKPNLSYRQFTLVLGVFVALMVALTVWASQKNITSVQPNLGSSSTLTTPVLEQILRTVSSVRF